MTIQKIGENAYFAASNSVAGFFSYYDAIFKAARIRQVYAIKGGPGTGKSSFLRAVADYAQACGWSCEYIYCSSDPMSLDAVILSYKQEECIAFLDATSPHVYEPTLPGAREEIINLGVFWNSARLREKREEIEHFNNQKSAAYRRAYRFLAGFGEMSKTVDGLMVPYIKREKIALLAEKLMQGIPHGTEYSAAPALMHSVGMRGTVGFDTYFSQAKRLYVIEDCRGSAQYLMCELASLAQRMRLAVRLSYDPVEPDKLDGIFLCSGGEAFVVCKPNDCEFPHKRINMRRFVDTAAMKKTRNSVNYACRMRKAMLFGATEALEEVGEMHFRLEEIYSSAMNFEAKENFTKSFCLTTFGLQTK